MSIIAVLLVASMIFAFHIINNMHAIVFVAKIGENAFNKTLSFMVAIGLDNDCNGASIGSILEVILKFDNIPFTWYENFNLSVHTYIKGEEVLSLEVIV